MAVATAAAVVVLSSPVQRTDSPLSLDSNRTSLASSVASFHTARTVTPLDSPHSLRSPSISSTTESVYTLGPTSPRESDVNTVHGTYSPEVRIVNVTNDTIQAEPSPPQRSSFQREPAHRVHAGPPPPSPPASVERDVDDDGHNDQRRSISFPPPSRPGRSASGSRSLTFEEPTSHPRDLPLSLRAGSSQESLREQKKPPKSRPQVSISLPSPPILEKTPSITTAPDGLLRPPSLPTHSHRDRERGRQHERPTRRNTTGSSPRTTHSGGFSRHRHHASQVEDGYRSDGELANDIQLHAEQIRRERMRMRAKAQEAEAALLQPIKDIPLVGNLIGEDHVNYVLMYNMLTGIRIGVSRCQAKIKRPLTDEDFTARHKFTFDIIGNELTPSAKYDFKFKDYAPWVFRELRETHFHVDPADYLVSLTEKYILSELGSSGKSGSFFYFSRDYRFIIKTIHPSEHKLLLSILKSYHEHVKNNPHTLLSRFYGLHRVKLPRGRKIHFVIMNNLFPPHRDIHETYDLKGSTVGRLFPEDKAEKNPRAVLKDVNWINRGKQLVLGPEKKALLCEQLRRDTEWLKSVNVMDYSLLVGIHNMQRGNKDNVRRNTLKVFSPEVSQIRRKATSQKGAKSPEAVAMRRAIGAKRATTSKDFTLSDTDAMTGDRQDFLFYQDEGGLQSTGEDNELLDTIYYLGVIDILTPYTVFKRVERLWKGISADIHKISPVPPSEYGDRFFKFMKAIMSGGAGGKSFLPD